jgi:hypothetical protein
LFDKQQWDTFSRYVHKAVLGGSGKIKQIHPLDNEETINFACLEFFLKIVRSRIDFSRRHFEVVSDFHNFSYSLR